MKNLTLFGINYEVSDESVAYNEYRAVFFKEACAAEKKMYDYCETHELEDRSGFMELAEFGRQLVNNGLAVVVKNLSEKEIYDYSVDSIRRMVVEPLTKFDEAVNYVVSSLDDIDAELRAAEAARQREINSASSSWSGGGFGIEGALKGAAQAAILNAASGAVTKALTSGDSKRAKSSYEMKIYNLLNGTDTVNKLCRAVYDDIFYLVKTYTKILIEDKKEQIRVVDDAEIMKSNDIFNNIKSGVYTKPEIEQQMWIKVFALFPYNIDYFILLIKMHEENLEEIKTLIDWYNLPMSRIADKLLDDKFSFDDITDVEAAQEKKALLLEDLAKYGVSDSYLVKAADTKIDELLVLRRTYEGIVYDTDEDCEHAKALDTTLSEKISGVSTSDFNSLMEAYFDIIGADDFDKYNAVYKKNATKLHEPVISAVKSSNSAEELSAVNEKLHSANAELNAPLIKLIESKIKSINTREKAGEMKDKAVDAAKGLFGKAKGIFKK